MWESRCLKEHHILAQGLKVFDFWVLRIYMVLSLSIPFQCVASSPIFYIPLTTPACKSKPTCWVQREAKMLRMSISNALTEELHLWIWYHIPTKNLELLSLWVLPLVSSALVPLLINLGLHSTWISNILSLKWVLTIVCSPSNIFRASDFFCVCYL